METDASVGATERVRDLERIGPDRQAGDGRACSHGPIWSRPAELITRRASRDHRLDTGSESPAQATSYPPPTLGTSEVGLGVAQGPSGSPCWSHTAIGIGHRGRVCTCAEVMDVLGIG